jgi:hypothetical protein
MNVFDLGDCPIEDYVTSIQSFTKLQETKIRETGDDALLTTYATKEAVWR